MQFSKFTLLSAAAIAFCATDALAATPTHVQPHPGAPGIAVAKDHPAVARALTLIRNNPATTRASANDAFHPRAVVVDANGTEHVRFDRTWQGLPVIGGDLVVHARNGRHQATSLTQHAPLNLGTTRPTLQSTDAIVAAGTEFGAHFAGKPESTLVVHARGATPRLAYQVRLANAADDMTYIVDAHTGRILERWSNNHTATANGTAKTLYSGDVPFTTNSILGGFEMRDPTRGNARTIDASNARTSGQVFKDTDNVWGNNAMSDRASVATDAQYGHAVTWDYYRTVHNRLGIANDGKAAYNRVHYGFRYGNAFWNNACFCMTYGDGDGSVIGPLVSLDIAGHEMSHGVNAAAANLIYSGESGGLNEANSDILGTMVEFHANNAKDAPDYLIGEKIFLANTPNMPNPRFLRSMFNPISDGKSPNCYVPTLGNLDVHYSSGVANLFFYLLAEGTTAKTLGGVNHAPTTCNGARFAGIGRDKASRIWYRALTVYFTSSTNYAGARVGTLNAARDLYGIGSAEATAVAAAWSAVQVN